MEKQEFCYLGDIIGKVTSKIKYKKLLTLNGTHSSEQILLPHICTKLAQLRANKSPQKKIFLTTTSLILIKIGVCGYLIAKTHCANITFF